MSKTEEAKDLGKKNKDKVNKLDKKDYKGMYLRALADYDNLKKDTERQKQDWVRFANTNLITEILPVLDNFKVAIDHVPDNQGDSGWVVGVKHIQDQLQNVLKNSGVEEIKTVGEKFNPEMHEAVIVDDINESKAVEKGTIFKEIKPGYIMHGKVISHAKVLVG